MKRRRGRGRKLQRRGVKEGEMKKRSGERGRKRMGVGG